MAHCRWAFADFIIMRWPAALSLYLSGLLIGRKLLPYEWTGYGRSMSGWRCPQKNPEDSTVGSVNPYTRDSNLSVVTRYPSIETAQVSPRFISNCLYSWPRFFERWITLSTVSMSIRWIAQYVLWAIYPWEGVIRPLNDWSLDDLFSLLKNTTITFSRVRIQIF